MVQWLTNSTRNHEVSGSIPVLAQWVRDPALPWLWCTPVTTAPIRSLAWEPPYAAGAAQEIPKKIQKKKKSKFRGVPVMAQRLTNLTRIHEDADSIPGPAQWMKDPALL